MSDRVRLEVDGQAIERFLSYEIESDLYVADDAFSLEVANPEITVKRGMRCQLFVNDELELTGIIDRCERRYDKRGLSYRITGRDLMGLLVDSYCEQFVTVEGKKLSELAAMLLKDVPYIQREKIEYQEDIVGKLKGKKRTVDEPLLGFMDTPQRIAQIEPGMTKFEVLRNYASSRGMMFWCNPDGTFVFGRPKASGEPAYHLTCRRDGRGNNVLEGEEIDDISRRYSKIVVIGQQQGGDDLDGPEAINTRAERIDPDFPFYKPFVTQDNNDHQSPALRARMIMEQQRHEGYQLMYTVQGHSQQGHNWRPNELCRTHDEVLGVDGVYLVYGRTMIRSRRDGTKTRLKLGTPGLVA